jgi:hypothetical protein
MRLDTSRLSRDCGLHTEVQQSKVSSRLVLLEFQTTMKKVDERKEISGKRRLVQKGSARLPWQRIGPINMIQVGPGLRLSGNTA